MERHHCRLGREGKQQGRRVARAHHALGSSPNGVEVEVVEQLLGPVATLGADQCPHLVVEEHLVDGLGALPDRTCKVVVLTIVAWMYHRNEAHVLKHVRAAVDVRLAQPAPGRNEADGIALMEVQGSDPSHYLCPPITALSSQFAFMRHTPSRA